MSKSPVEEARSAVRERVRLPDSPFEPGAVFVPSELRLQNGKLLWTMDNPVFRVPRGSVLESSGVCTENLTPIKLFMISPVALVSLGSASTIFLDLTGK